MGRRTAGLEGIQGEAALIAGMSPLIVGFEFGREFDHRWVIHRRNGHSCLRWRYDEESRENCQQGGIKRFIGISKLPPLFSRTIVQF